MIIPNIYTVIIKTKDNKFIKIFEDNEGIHYSVNGKDKIIDGTDIKVLCIIAGLEKLQASMNDKNFKGFFGGIKTLPNVNLVFVDSSFKLKKVGFEPWYTSVVNNSNGIWVGPGFMEQTVINCNDYNNNHKEKINKQYAWIAKNGEADLVKIAGEKELEDEE